MFVSPVQRGLGGEGVGMSSVGEARRFVSPGLPGETRRSASDDAEGALGERGFSMSPSGGSRLPKPPPLGRQSLPRAFPTSWERRGTDD